MRRSRISVKPNFRAGNRTGTEGEQASQPVSEVGDTLPAVEAEEVETSHQQNVAPKELSEDVGIKDANEMSSQINQTDGAPSSGATASSAAPQRRMRISATPKLLGPKLTSTPRTRPVAKMPSSAPSPLTNEEPVQIHDSPSEALASVSVISNDLPESGTPTKSSTKLPRQSSTMTQSSSPCVPSKSGLRKNPVCGTKSVEDSPPSPQPGQVPQQPPQEPEPLECPSSSDLSSVSIMPSYCDKADSSEMTEKSSDKDRIIRALKLKELMKIERRKDIQMGKRRVGHKEYTELDHSKMTMRDLIYYLPDTSPMRSSVEIEESQAETIIPPSPRQQIKTAEKDDDDEEEEEESENEGMLVPKVRVAEDGSIILDEESLTVRVQRPSNIKVVESSTALFERGSTTTYSSFRTLNHVKSWSVRETDLFFLAISMVGTDFSLIGQLLTHRSRVAIKNKFKKEERVNSWRVDKALRNKRPYDKEFFSYLLEKVLAKDKDKRKSIRLIVPKNRKARKCKDNHEELEDDDDGDVSLEKENEDVSNVKDADTSVPAKKRRKRTRGVSKDKDNDKSTEKQGKRNGQRKCSKKMREVHSSDDTEGESNLNIEGDTININKEDDLERSTSASKRRRKRSESDEEKQNEKPIKGTKGKRLKKSLKAVDRDQEESAREHEESSIMDEDGSATKKKRKQAKNGDLDGDVLDKGKKNTKRKKALKSTVEEEGTTQDGEASADLQEAEKLNAPATAEVADHVPPKTTRRSKKPLPNLATKRSRKSNKPEVERESQDENNHESILTEVGSPLGDERLQMQAVVVLEKTSPRQQNLRSPSKVQCKNNELEPSVSSPGSSSSSESSSAKQTRIQKAGRVKRSLSTSRKTGRRKGMMDQDEAEPESPVALLERITQESEHEEDDNSLNENLIDISCLRDLNSQSFQRRPMVVLSREEVDMVLDASDHSADEDPSVSPLDLSLNTELSFPLQCSKLMEDNDEEAEVDYVCEEHEERTNERVSCEERNCEELELTKLSFGTKSALAQPDITNLRDISTTLNPEVCSQPEVAQSKVTTPCPVEEVEPPVHPMACKNVTTGVAVLEGSPPLGVLDNVEPICMKPDAPMTQETVAIEITTLGTSLVVSDVMEDSVKAMLPTLLKESALASSEIIAQSKMTPTGSGLGSQGPLQTTPEKKGDLQTSLERPSQTLETLQGPESKEDTQALPSDMASPGKKARMQGCAVAPEVKEESQEEVSVQSSSASVSSEHGIRATWRSRFLKPKPNLSQKSRVTLLQNQRQDLKVPSTLKPKSSEPTVPPEKIIHSPDQHDALDLRKEDLTKEEETSQSNSVDQMESESTKVPDQGTITTMTLSPASADEPQMASESLVSRCDMIPPYTTLTLPQPSQSREDSGQMIVPSEEVCAPADILHLSEEGYSDEEPTFILTLYEIPVTQAYLPSSSNDSVTTSDLSTVETQCDMGFSDQAHTLPSTSESYREISGTEKVDSQNDLGVGAVDLAVNVKEQISAHSISASQHVFVPVSEETGCDSSKDRTLDLESKLQSKEASSVSVTEGFAINIKEQTTSYEPISLGTKVEESDASANLETGISYMDPNSECQKGSEFTPVEDLASRTRSTPSGFNISKCITTLPQGQEDTEQCARVSHMVLADVFVPVSEETVDNSSKDRTMDVECKRESMEASSASVTEELAENGKEQISEHMASPEPVLLDTKDEESDVCANLEMGIPHLDPCSECKKGSEIAPFEDLVPRNQSTPFGFSVSKCVEILPQDPEDTEQCEGVSHMVLADVFVPVSEETEDDSDKDRTMDVECKLHSKEASTESLSERQDTRYEELTKVDNSPANHTEESKDTPPLPEEKKTPARRRVRQIKPQPKLVKRACAKDDSSKTDQLVKEPIQPASSRVVLPASHEENLAGISNTTDEKSVDRMSTRRGNKTSVSRVLKGKEAKPKTVTEEYPKISQCDLVPTESKPTSTALNLAKEPTLEGENSENVTGDTTIKDDMESSVEDKELSILMSSEGANMQPCGEDMHFSLVKSSGSGSLTVNSEETEAETQGVSHMVLTPDVFVLVSDETKDDLSNNWTVSIESSPQRVSLPKKELKTEDVSQTLIEESTQNQSPLVDIKTPVRKRGKQEVKRMCTKNESTKTRLSQPTSPEASAPPSQLNPLAQNENMVLEEKLQRKHHIMPCTVRLSSHDTVAQSLNAPQLGDRKSNDESTPMSSPTCPTTVTTLSEESSSLALFKEMTMKDTELEKKSCTRRKGKKNESLPHTKRGHLVQVQTISQTRQLTITDWAKKKSHQTATNQEEKESVKSPQVQSSLKAKQVHQLTVEKQCSKSQHTDSEEPECSHVVSALEKAEEASGIFKEMKRSSEVVKESTEEPSVSQVKIAPARRRAKLQVKPILSKKACIKSEGNTSTTVRPQPSRFTSPTRQHARAAREEEESDNKTKQPVKEVSNTSSMEASSKSTESALITSSPQSSKSQDTWPRVILPCVKLCATEAGICSASSTPTSSPARVSERASPSVTSPQLKKSPTQSSSPTASENRDDDPSRVSQFFLCDIFTEVEEAE